MKIVVCKDGEKIVGAYTASGIDQNTMNSIVDSCRGIAILTGWYKDCQINVVDADDDGLLAFLATHDIPSIGVDKINDMEQRKRFAGASE